LLLIHVVARRIAWALPTFKLADGRIVVLEGTASVAATIDHRAAGKLDRVAAAIHRASRTRAGMEV
jgi:hypothetical protein